MDNNEKNVCNLKVKKCLICGAETNENDKKELFCTQCGTPVLNRCSNYECGKSLSSDERYCKYCGGRSIFLNYGLFEANPHDFDNILPF